MLQRARNGDGVRHTCLFDNAFEMIIAIVRPSDALQKKLPDQRSLLFSYITVYKLSHLSRTAAEMPSSPRLL